MESHSRRGFTLIELMIVVAITGVLAAIAIPSYGKYVRKSKTAEALTNIRKIYDGEVSFYQDEHTNSAGVLLSKSFVFCVPQPAVKPGKDKRLGNWDDVGWPQIRFAVDGPVLYTYLVQIYPYITFTLPSWIPPLGVDTPTNISVGFAARAVGDQDEDGKPSEFMRICGVNAITGEFEGGAGVSTLDPEE